MFSADSFPSSPEGRRVARGIFEAYRTEGGQGVNAGRLLSAIESTGVRPRSDPRLAGLMAHLLEIHAAEGECGAAVENLELDLRALHRVVDDSVILLGAIFQNTLVLPQFEDFCSRVQEIYDKCRGNTGGKVVPGKKNCRFSPAPHLPPIGFFVFFQVASYIPQLSRYSPDQWACSVCTVDGQRLSLGDVDTKFTLQSCRLEEKKTLQLRRRLLSMTTLLPHVPLFMLLLLPRVASLAFLKSQIREICWGGGLLKKFRSKLQ